MLRTLRQGSNGADVARLQQFLTARKFYQGECDGRIGPITAAAIVAYQKAHAAPPWELEPDGVAGQRTLAAMLAEGLALVVDADEDHFPPVPDWMTPLRSNEERMRRFGRFEYRPAPEPGNREAIEILGDWEDKNIVTVACPVFEKNVRVHRAVAADYLTFMQHVIDSDLRRLLFTFDGSFVPRYQRGSTKALSNHSWGTAFDVNYEWNQLGHTPAYRGQKGSVRELVPLANQHGWYWGGHFRSRPDGMHFEHC